MNLNAINELNWIINNLFKDESYISKLLKSINIDYDNNQERFYDFLNQLNEAGDEETVIRIINIFLQDPNVRSLYNQEYGAWNFGFEFVFDHVNRLFDILKSEGYEIEQFQIKTTGTITRIAPVTFNFIENKFIQDKFYFDLTMDFNKIYRNGFFWLLPFILRKILENYLIDILRKKFGMSNIDLFYRPAQNRFQDFSKLISNFNDKLNDFKAYSSQIDNKCISLLEKYRVKGNSSAHSIELFVTKADIDKDHAEIHYIINLLNSILSNIT